MLLYDSKLHLFPSKLKSRWTGPFIIHQVYLNGSVDLLNSKDSRVFKVNGQRLKPHAVQHTTDKEEIPLLDPSINPTGYSELAWSPLRLKCHSIFLCLMNFIWFIPSFSCSLVMTAFSHSLMHILTLCFLEYCFTSVVDSPPASSAAPQLAHAEDDIPPAAHH